MADDICRRVGPDLEELALGVLGGRERAEVLAHIEECPDCAARLAQLSEVSDALIDLIPANEPPVGFENRMLDRLGVAGRAVVPAPSPEGRSGFLRRRRWPVVALAAACAAAFFVAGFAVDGARRQSPAPAAATTSSDPVLVAALSNDGRTVGQVYVDASSHPWIYVGLHGVDTRTTVVRCFLIYRGGRVEDLGSYPVSAGAAGWGASISDPTGVTGARIATNSGTTIATATF